MNSLNLSKVGAVVALLMLVLPPAMLSAQQGEDAQTQDQPRQIQVTILGMSCPFCAYGVEQKLKRLEGVTDLEVALQSGIATLVLTEGADLSNEQLIETVEEAGFEVAKIVRNFESEHPDFERERRG